MRVGKKEREGRRGGRDRKGEDERGREQERRERARSVVHELPAGGRKRQGGAGSVFHTARSVGPGGHG